MPARTKISWCDYSSNPLRARANGKQGWSCAMISPECAHCYASELNNRFGTQLPFNTKGVAESEHYLDEKELRHILSFKPKGPFKNGRKRPMVFPFDMTDVFGDWVPFETIDKLFAAFALRPDVDFMVLTKRAERMAEYISRAVGRIHDESLRLFRDPSFRSGTYQCGPKGQWADDHWPLPNVWLGVSVGVKATMPRIDTLREIPAALRFVSFEPLLESLGEVNLEGIGLGITGGESGSKARSCNLAWSRDIGRQCQAAGISWFHKQHGSNVLGFDGICPCCGDQDWGAFDGRPGVASVANCNRCEADVSRLKDRAGADPSEWGDGWQQQMPGVT